MKKILHWLDENLEEFILVIFLIAMTLIIGILQICSWNVPVLVRRTYQISLHLVWILECKLLQQKMPFY